MLAGGQALHFLRKIQNHYPLAMHSVGMSLGSSDPLNWDYLKKIKVLKEAIQPLIISDHLCWVSLQGRYLHELLPLPQTEEAISHVAERIRQVQDFLQQRIAIENVSSYLSYRCSQMPEWEFINTVAQQADCDILLDINNIYVSAKNHHFAALDYLNAIDKQRVVQFHIAGYQDVGTHLLDTHGDNVQPAVWQLYRVAVQRFPNVPTLIEWDKNIPPFSQLLQQVQLAQSIIEEETQAHAT